MENSLESLSDPINAFSVEDVNALVQEFTTKYQQQFPQNETIYNELIALAGQVSNRIEFYC